MFFSLSSEAAVVSCNSEVWSPEVCAPMTSAFKKDPYSYLSHITKTTSAANIAIISGANRGLVPVWNTQFWNVIGRAGELSGFVQSQIQDPRKVTVKDPHSNRTEETSAFSGCYFLRDDVIDTDVKICDEFLEPAARIFYLAMSAYEALCEDAEDASKCPALEKFYH